MFINVWHKYMTYVIRQSLLKSYIFCVYTVWLNEHRKSTENITLFLVLSDGVDLIKEKVRVKYISIDIYDLLSLFCLLSFCIFISSGRTCVWLSTCQWPKTNCLHLIQINVNNTLLMLYFCFGSIYMFRF